MTVRGSHQRRFGLAIGALCLSATLVDPPRGASGAAGWVDISPPGSALSELAAGPGRDPVLLVAHPTLGIYRSSDGGRNWTAAGADLQNPWGSAWVTALDLAADGARAAAGTRGGGLFLSNDGGAVWRPAGMGFDLSVEVITRIRFNPRNSEHLLVGTDAGLFRSVDAGQSVQRVRIPTGGRAPGAVVGLAFHPADSLRAYASLDPGGLFATSDGGATWVPAGSGLLTPPRILAFRQAESTVALAGGASGLSRWRGDLRRWAPLGRGLPRRQPLSALVARPDAPGHWLAGTVDGRVYATEDDGESWWRLNGPLQPGPLRLSATVDGAVLLAGGGGLFISRDGGESWLPLDRGLPGFRPRVLLADPVTPGTLIVAGAAGIRGTRTYGAAWERLGDGLPPAACAFGDLAAARAAPLRLAAATDDGVIRSEDGGRTWWGTGLGAWSGAVAWLGPPAAGLMAVGVEGETTRLWRSPDDGATWSEVTRAPLDPGAWVLDTRAGLFLAGRVLQRSDDGGGAWNSLELPPGARRVTALSARDPAELLCGTDVGLFASADRGRSWRAAGFVAERILGLVCGGPAEATLLVLTARALHVSRGNGLPWARVELPPTLGEPLAVALDASGRVAYVAGGGGLFAREMSPAEKAGRSARP